MDLAAQEGLTCYDDVDVACITNICHCRGSVDERDEVELELPDSMEQLHRQFYLHETTAASVEPRHNAPISLRTVDDVYLSVLQNLILVGNVVLISHCSRN